jgi:hypothetical protein
MHVASIEVWLKISKTFQRQRSLLCKDRVFSNKQLKRESFALSKFGPPSVLAIEEIPRPEPGAGEALVQVKAAAINPSDVKNIAGLFPATALPRTPGRDFSGIVVTGTRYQGQEVWCSGPGLGMTHDGAQAEYVTVPEEALAQARIAAQRKTASIPMSIFEDPRELRHCARTAVSIPNGSSEGTGSPARRASANAWSSNCSVPFMQTRRSPVR